MDETLLDLNEFCILLLKHLVRDPVVFKKAKELGITPEDFLSSPLGYRLYYKLAEIILDINSSPIDMLFLIGVVKNYIERGKIEEIHQQKLAELLITLYEGELKTEFILANLGKFIRRRREEKAKLLYNNDTNRLREELNKIAVEVSLREKCYQEAIFNPFETLILPIKYELLPIGFKTADAVLGGIGQGEYGLIIGFTGGGKTAMGVHIAHHNASIGNPVTYCVLEDEPDKIAIRFYARQYMIPYGLLRTGMASLQLEDAFEKDKSDNKKILAKNLRVYGLKDHVPIKISELKELIIKDFETTGFVPKLIIIDQMQFLETSVRVDTSQSWLIDKTLAAECDEFSHEKINGNKFALWVLHQAKGKNQLTFTKEQIEGYKGITHKPEIVLGLGTEADLQHFCLFGMKTRHAPYFKLRLRNNLKYMRFEEILDDIAPIEHRLNVPNSLLTTV